MFLGTLGFIRRSDGCSGERSRGGISHRRLVGRGWRHRGAFTPSFPLELFLPKGWSGKLCEAFCILVFGRCLPTRAWTLLANRRLERFHPPQDLLLGISRFSPRTAKNIPNFCLIPTAVHWMSSSYPCTGSQGRWTFRSIICWTSAGQKVPPRPSDCSSLRVWDEFPEIQKYIWCIPNWGIPIICVRIVPKRTWT